MSRLERETPQPELDLLDLVELLDGNEGRDDRDELYDRLPPKLPPRAPRARRSCAGHANRMLIASIENRRLVRRNMARIASVL